MRIRTVGGVLPLVLVAAVAPAHAAIVITEVAAWSSGNSTVGADWIELANTGSSAVSLINWRMDDNSNSLAASVALRGVTSIAPGQSVVFFEGDSSGSNDASITALFNSVWGTSLVFGTSLGAYGGSGVGLGTGGDAVNIFDDLGALQATVSFGASPGASPFATFDNSAGLNNVVLTTLSVAGVNGAFAVLDNGSTLIGSPGVPAVPLPASIWLLMSGGAFLMGIRRRARGEAAADRA